MLQIARLGLVAMLIAFMATGCANAMIKMNDGSVVEGSIKSATNDTIEVEVEGEDDAREVDRSKVVSIDHPGDIEMIVGGSIFAVGLGLMIPGLIFFLDEADTNVGACSFATDCPEVDSELTGIVLFASGTALVIGGIATAFTGLSMFMTSTGNAEAKADEAAFNVAPFAGPDGKGGAMGGAALTITW